MMIVLKVYICVPTKLFAVPRVFGNYYGRIQTSNASSIKLL